MSDDQIIDHDSWNYTPAKLPRQSKITLGSIYNVLPFDGVRNPGFRSSCAHRLWLTYCCRANACKSKIGIAESAAEAAVAYELLLSSNLHDLHFQPLSVKFKDENGKRRTYTHDVLAEFVDGRRVLYFVRNSDSLKKPKTWRDIEAIRSATPKDAADGMIIVDAGLYSRPRRENLFRLYQAVQTLDDETDDLVLRTAREHQKLWLMRDLISSVELPQYLVFQSCLRLIARGHLLANLDHVIAEWSRIDVVA